VILNVPFKYNFDLTAPACSGGGDPAEEKDPGYDGDPRVTVE